MKKQLLTLLFLCLTIVAHAQNFPKNANKTDKKGLRQGKWTVLYGKDGKTTTDTSKVSFYRLITYKDDKPVGKVKDHYKNGMLQKEGTLLQDKPEDVWEGCVMLYTLLGTKEREVIYKSGKIETETIIDKNSWWALDAEGTSLFRAGKYNEAEIIFEKAKIQAEKEFGKDNEDYAIACSHLALVYQAQNKYAKAEALFIETKNIRTKVLGKEHADYADVCNNLGLLYEKQGKHREAEIFYVETVTILEKLLGKEHPHYAAVCNNLGLLYKKQGKYSKAESLLIEAKNIREKVLGKEDSHYADICNNLGTLYEDLGIYAKAESLLIEAKNIREKVLSKEHPDYATSCSNLSGLYRNLGKYTEAEALLVEAKNVWTKAVGKEHVAYSTSCNNLGELYTKLGKYTEAETLLIEAKNIREKVLGKEHLAYAIVCSNVGILYEKQKKYAEAEVLQIEAKNIFEKKLAKENLEYMAVCNNLATVYKNQDKFQESLNLYTEAKNISEKIFGKEHLSYAAFCNNLASLYKDQNKYIEAENFYIESEKSYLSQIERNFSNLSEKERGQFYQTFSNNLNSFTSFASYRYAQNKNITTDIYDNKLVTKALLFNANNKMRERIMQSNDEALKALYQDWRDKKEYLAKVYQLTVANRQKQGIDVGKLESEANEVEKKLASQSELFAKATDKTRYTWQDVQKILKVGEVAIEMIRFQIYDKKAKDTTKYMALLIKPNSQYPEMVVLHNGNDLEGKHFKNYTDGITNKKADKNSYLQYWAKIAQQLTGVKKVYLSADGFYQKLNLNTLLNPATGKYLLEELDIQLVTSTRDLVLPKKESKPFTSAVLMGFPAYNTAPEKTEIAKMPKMPNDTTQRFFNGENIEELPATKVEIAELQEILAKTTIQTQAYTGKEASEPTLKQVNSPSILHIATHGFFMESPKKETDKELTLGMDSKKVFENPLLRSGVLLAHAKNAIKEGGDGILTAYEAMNLNLDETDLVVLSACDTGLGEIKNGEGVYGLQRTFQTAGAKTVLMSLWKVSDNATQELSSLFYRNLILKKQSKQLAFKNAQTELRQRYPHPYYWGAFVMVGE